MPELNHNKAAVSKLLALHALVRATVAMSRQHCASTLSAQPCVLLTCEVTAPPLMRSCAEVVGFGSAGIHGNGSGCGARVSASASADPRNLDGGSVPCLQREPADPRGELWGISQG